ncbi:MAG: hypothetical protein ACK4UO_04960 [Pseudolabrys sp.]
MAKPDSGGSNKVATREDIRSILGPVDTDKLLAILDLQPTVADLETALLWMSGDTDIFGAEPPIKGAASEIVTILTAEESEEEEPRAG